MPYRALLWSEVPSLARLEAQEWLHHRSHSSQGIELPCKLCWHHRIRLHKQHGTHTVLDAQNGQHARIIHTCGFPRRATWISVDAGGSGRPRRSRRGDGGVWRVAASIGCVDAVEARHALEVSARGAAVVTGKRSGEACGVLGAGVCHDHGSYWSWRGRRPRSRGNVAARSLGVRRVEASSASSVSFSGTAEAATRPTRDRASGHGYVRR